MMSGAEWRWFEFQTINSSNIYKVVFCHDVSKIEVSDANCFSPEFYASEFDNIPRDRWPRGCCITPQGWDTPFRNAAKHAFGNMTIDHMKLMCQHPDLKIEFG